MPPATSAWARKLAPSVAACCSTPCSCSETGSAPKRSVFVQVGALGLAGLPAAADGDDRLAAADRRLDGRHGDHLAVEGNRSKLPRPIVGLRVGAPHLAGLVLEVEDHAELSLVAARRHAGRVDLATVEQDTDLAIGDQLADVLPIGERLALRIEELQLSGGADQVAHLLLVD